LEAQAKSLKRCQGNSTINFSKVLLSNVTAFNTLSRQWCFNQEVRMRLRHGSFEENGMERVTLNFSDPHLTSNTIEIKVSERIKTVLPNVFRLREEKRA